MAITGMLIKAAIHLQQYIVPETEDGVKEQVNQLRYLLDKAKHTSFGIYYGFEDILRSNDIRREFIRKVPVYEYDDIFKRWWCRSLEGEKDICWPDRVNYFALSSGTTGSESKRIPVTKDMLHAIQKTSLQQIFSLSHYDLPVDFFEKDILLVGSTTSLEDKGLYKQGEISGISASNIPEWFSSYYKPGNEIAGIEDWDEKVDTIVQRAPEWDVGAMAGIPAWYQVMLERIIKYYDVDTIHDIWPNLKVYASGGVAFEPYQHNFEKLFGKPVYILDTYLASEGYLAFQAKPEGHAMKLVLNNGIFFEFIPFNDKNFDQDGKLVDGPESHLLEEVEEGTEYAVVISTCSGAWRYLIGDTIRFTSKKDYEIVITGRTKHFMNVAGSQLSVEKMNAGIKMLQEEFNVEITDFLVSAIDYEGGFAHKWYMGSKQDFDKYVAAEKLDQYFKQVNKNYKVARTRALKAVYIETVPSDYFLQYHANFKSVGGQSKTPRVMKKEQFKEFEEFIEVLRNTEPLKKVK